MALKGLAVLMGKGMDGGDDSEEESPSSSKPAIEDERLTDAYDALHKMDRRSFIDSMKEAIRACISAEDAGEYDKKDEPKVVGQGAE